MILDNELYKLLQQSPKKDGKHTHTIPGKGAYFIEKENLDKFYKFIQQKYWLQTAQHYYWCCSFDSTDRGTTKTKKRLSSKYCHPWNESIWWKVEKQIKMVLLLFIMHNMHSVR